MSSHQEMMEIMSRLRADAETEMTRDDLERMLEEELAKPEGQMDEALIREIVMVLEEGVTPEEQAAAWQATQEKLTRKRTHPVLAWGMRIAAILVAIFTLTALTYRTAEAFHWQLLLRWMRPFAETFMLYSGDPPQRPEGLYTDSPMAAESATYTAAEEAPRTFAGYPVRPGAMPERFAYCQGSCYADELAYTFTHVFGSDEGVCIFTALIIRGEDQVTALHHPGVDEGAQERCIAGCQVTYSLAPDGTASAYWALDDASYSLSGPIGEEELVRIIESVMTE